MSASVPAPLPVQQRAWTTRVRILEAAVACLAEEGYGAATTSRIQARARVSRGSLLHQFPSRDALLVAAVQHLAHARTADLDAQPERTVGDIGASVDALWDTFHGPLFAATLELWVAGKNSPELAKVLAPYERELGRSIRVAVARMFGPALAGRPSFNDLVSLLLTSMRGVALTYTFERRDHRQDPNIPIWRGLATTYLEGAVELTRLGGHPDLGHIARGGGPDGPTEQLLPGVPGTGRGVGSSDRQDHRRGRS